MDVSWNQINCLSSHRLLCILNAGNCCPGRGTPPLTRSSVLVWSPNLWPSWDCPTVLPSSLKHLGRWPTLPLGRLTRRPPWSTAGPFLLSLGWSRPPTSTSVSKLSGLLETLLVSNTLFVNMMSRHRFELVVQRDHFYVPLLRWRIGSAGQGDQAWSCSCPAQSALGAWPLCIKCKYLLSNVHVKSPWVLKRVSKMLTIHWNKSFQSHVGP